MSANTARWGAYIVVVYIALLVATGKIQRFDSLWLVLFATFLMLPSAPGFKKGRDE